MWGKIKIPMYRLWLHSLYGLHGHGFSFSNKAPVLVISRFWLQYFYSHSQRFHLRNLVHHTVYPKKYAHGFCFAVLCCGYRLTDFPISIGLTSLALWQSNDCPSASKATLMNMDKYFMWIHYERLHNHNKAKYNKTVCIFLRIYCMLFTWNVSVPQFTVFFIFVYLCSVLYCHDLVSSGFTAITQVWWNRVNALYKSAKDCLYDQSRKRTKYVCELYCMLNGTTNMD